MISRWIWFWVALLMGIILLITGYLVPAHVRAVNASVLHAAGRGTASVGAQAAVFLKQHKLGPAQLLMELAEAEGLDGRPALAASYQSLSTIRPELKSWGAPQPAWSESAAVPHPSSEAFTDYVVRAGNRTKLLEFLNRSRNPGVQTLISCRELTNTVIFPPSWTSSGQAFDAALAVSGLLIEHGSMNEALGQSISTMAAAAASGENPQRLEQALLDMMSLGQRLNWGQLSDLSARIGDAETLRILVNLIRRSEAQLPALYSAISLAGDAKPVTEYLVNFSDTGTGDLRAALHENTGGLRLLVERNKRLKHSPADNLLNNFVPFDRLAQIGWKSPALALALKWLLYLLAGYFLALSAYLLMRARAARYEVFDSDTRFLRRDENERRQLVLPPVRGMHVAREFLFALGFLVLILLFTEPFLTHDSQKLSFPFHLRLPVLTAAAQAESASKAHTSIMNQLSLLTLLLFFVLQALIYTACMFKLSEIRRQKLGPRMKLKLLDNEDHLFDAGLYLGFVGTIISLILVSLGVVKPSLMAAYSSTSFGIIFVSFFKIFNLRPTKRRLLLEAEAVREGAMSEDPRSEALP